MTDLISRDDALKELCDIGFLPHYPASVAIRALPAVQVGVKPLNTPEAYKLKTDAGIPNLPTQLTYECRMAISGQGPKAYNWADKPHRLIYDLCREIERLAALSPTPVAASQTPDPVINDPRVVALVEAAKSGLNSLQNTESEFGIILGSADKLRAALRAIGGEA